MPTYVVTGASSGIGLEVVRQLAARGDKVFATVRKRENSATGEDFISNIAGDVTVVEGIDVSKDDVGARLAASALAGVVINGIIHNAGGFNGARDEEKDMSGQMKDQQLGGVSADRMISAFNLNCVGVLRVQQALGPQIADNSGKVMVISSGLGSIGDNGSGGMYAYRASKAAVNMVSKGMAMDLKKRGISVVTFNPAMVVTFFAGKNKEAMERMGAMPVEVSCSQLLKCLDDLNIDNTGRFMTAKNDNSGPLPFSAGW